MVKKRELGNIKPFKEDLIEFNILCQRKDMTQAELFEEILEEYRHNGK